MRKQKSRILVVEDEPSFLDYYCNIIRGLEYKVRASEGQGSLIYLMEKCQPQLILMDSILPSTYGWKECRRMRETEYGKMTGIIGMSRDDWEKEWMEAGADLFLHKSEINFQTLKAAIETVLEKYKKPLTD